MATTSKLTTTTETAAEQHNARTHTQTRPRAIEVCECVCQGQKNQLDYGISMGSQLASVSATRFGIA